MESRKILRGLSEIFGVSSADLPKTVQRFKSEVEQMEKALRKNK